MNELKVFDNPEFGKVRTFIDGNEILFCASDVARSLGYSNPRDAVSKHCRGVVKRDIPTASGVQTVSFILESDVYRMIMRSNISGAERFQDWVVEDVLPSIRKTGKYETKLTRSERILDGYKLLMEQVDEMKPKADLYDDLMSSSDTIEIGDAAKVLGTGQHRLFAYLRNEGIFMSDNTPYQEYLDRGYFKVTVRPYEKPDGTKMVYQKTTVYPKGIEYIRNRMGAQ